MALHLTNPLCHFAVAPDPLWPQSCYVEDLERMGAKVILISKVPRPFYQGVCGSAVGGGAADLDKSLELEFKCQTWLLQCIRLPISQPWFSQL